MPQLEGDEEGKEGKGLKILTLNKLLTWLPILLAQVKGGNNSSQLINKIRQTFYLLYHHNQVITVMEENVIVTRVPKTSYFYFDCPKNVDENLKHRIEFIVKSTESLIK